MRTLKSLVVLITLLAVAVNPIAAAWIPCCCTKPVEVIEDTSECCETHTQTKSTRHADDNDSHPNCPTTADGISDTSLQHRACGCIQVPQTAQSNRNNLSAENSKRTFSQMACWPPVGVLFSRPVSCVNIEVSHTPLALSGPPLLALLCTWLK